MFDEFKDYMEKDLETRIEDERKFENSLNGIVGTTLSSLTSSYFDQTELYLYWNNINKENAYILAQALKNNKSLIEVDMSKSEVGEIFTIQKPMSVTIAPFSLQAPDKITPEEASELAFAIANHYSIKSLRLSINNADPLILSILVGTLQENKNIISFRDNRYLPNIKDFFKDNEKKAYFYLKKMLDGFDKLTPEDLKEIEERKSAINTVLKWEKEGDPDKYSNISNVDDFLNPQPTSSVFGIIYNYAMSFFVQPTR